MAAATSRRAFTWLLPGTTIEQKSRVEGMRVEAMTVEAMTVKAMRVDEGPVGS